MANRMDESGHGGHGVPGKPTMPGPQQGPPPNAMGMPGQPGMPGGPSLMAPNAASHGAMRYGYPPHGQPPQMHPNGPYSGMGQQSGNPSMGHPHGYPPQGTYGPNQQSQMHPSQQSPHGGQYMSMPPSQYPNKHPMSQPPPGASPSGPPPQPPHHSMMPSDRSYYGSRFAGPPPPQQGPPHHGQPTPPPLQQNPYYMRPPMGQQHPQSGKNYPYPNAGGPPPQHGSHYGQGPAGMISQQQHHQMMMHHHQMSQMQQPHAAYGPMSSHMGEGGGPPTATTTSMTHTTATSGHSGDNLRHPQPPSIIDEVSQTSTASSQAAEDSRESTSLPMSSHKGHSKQHHMSHPLTPNTSNLGSPGAASLSSFHDDFDSVSSPSWPRTPASPALNSGQFSSSTESHHHSTSKRSDSIQKLYEMSDEPDRKPFLDKFLQYQEERGSALTQVPTISKIPLDLFRLYLSVKERGGFVEVTRAKLWKDCAAVCNIANSSSAAYTLRKQYMKHLLPFECKFDRGGIDPGPVLSQLDAVTGSKKKSNSKAAAAAAQAAGSNPSTPSTRLSPSESSGQQPYHHAMPPSGPHPGYSEMEQQHAGYPPNATGHPPPPTGLHGGPPYPQGHPPGQLHHPHPEYPYPPPHSGATGHMPPPPPPPSQHPNMGNSSGAPQGPSHGESVAVKDPFADDEAAPSAPSASAYPARPHYAMPPGSQGPYYNQMPPSSQAQTQPPPHSGPVYPEGHPAHSQYPMEGQYARNSSAAPPTSESPSPNASMQHSQQFPGYSSRMSTGVPNGPSPHGYYSGSHGPQAQPGQQVPYEQAPHPPSQTHGRPPYEGHHGQRPMTPSSNEHYGPHHQPQPHPSGHPGQVGHRFPGTVGHPGAPGYGLRPPYNSAQSHHPAASSGAPMNAPQTGSPYTQAPPQQAPYGPGQEAYSKNSEQAFNAYPPNQPPFPPNATVGPLPPPAPSSGKTTPGSGSSHHPPAVSSAPYSGPPQGNSNISWMSSTSRSGYGQPKRHPDFAKPSSEHFVGYSQQPPYPPYPGSSPGSKPMSALGGGTPGQASGAWSREGGNTQYRMPSPSQFGHPPYVSSGQHSSGRESWHGESRSPSVPPPAQSGSSMESPSAGNWPLNRYPNYTTHESFANSPHSAHYSQAPHGGKPMAGFSNRHEGSNATYLMNTQGGHGPQGKMGPLPPGQLADRRAFTHPPGVPPLFHNIAASRQHALMRRDIIFPPNSVEATVPTPTKRRKLVARDLSAPIDAWRIYMSLKSGLLAESTFALDVLNIYSNDDSTLMYLGLNNMPGMLELLLEHYKCYLGEMFDNLFEDTEIGFEAKQLRIHLENEYGPDRKTQAKKKEIKRQLKWYELKKDFSDGEEEEEDEEDEEIVDEPERCLFVEKYFQTRNAQQLVLTNTTNYTHVSRFGKPKPVKYQKNSKSLLISDYEKKWDQIKNGFASGNEHWQKGGGETTSHIVSHMEPKENYLRFARRMQDRRAEKRTNGFAKEDDDQTSDQEAELENGVLPLEEECEPEQVKVPADVAAYPKIRDSDSARYWKRQHEPEYEEESYDQEAPPFVVGRDYQDAIKSRALTLSNLIRNITFVPGNDIEMVKHPGLLLVLSRLILLHHVHAIKKRQQTALNIEQINSLDEDTLFNMPEEKEDAAVPEKLMLEKEWWWDSLHIIRENTLVTLANLSAHLDLSPFPEPISINILDGILHWATCPSSYAQDSLPAAHPSLSPKRLAFETLSKLSIYEPNVDLILATPPWSRIEKLLKSLSNALGGYEEQTMREFALVLLSNFSCEQTTARCIALIGCTIQHLIFFMEQAEQSALHVANTQGYQTLRDNPDLMGTTVDMIRRCAFTLRNMARMPENRALFLQHEPRLLLLSTSQILDPSIVALIADILYEASFVTAKKALLAGKQKTNVELTPNDTSLKSIEKSTENAAKANHVKRVPSIEVKSEQPKDAESNKFDMNASISANSPATQQSPKQAVESPKLNTDAKQSKSEEPISKPSEENGILPAELVKPTEASNGLEPVAEKNHSRKSSVKSIEPAKNTTPASPPTSRVISNGVLTNNSHGNSNPNGNGDLASDGQLAPIEKAFFASGFNSLGDAYFEGRKGLPLPQESPLLVNEKQANKHHYYPSPYPSTHLTASGKAPVNSNGVLNSAGDKQAADCLDSSVAASERKNAVSNELNSNTVASTAPTATAAAVIEASTV